ncbi:MAG: FlgD immunoglobulin-like domain containing protein, partial [Candidatus Marinimicrobia bacterium]|nr:FlgD immunoglobulin-like domain containing protein [Candidatus Neomarinimicrobiota bacterium]
STTLGWVEFELLDTFDDYQTTVTMSRSRLNEEDILIDGSAAVYTNALLVVDEWGNGGGVPQVFALKQNFPNPFNPLTQIRYQLPKESLVTIQIYDIMGRLVRSLVSGQKELTGYHQVTWDATNNSGDPVSAGMYLYVIQAGEFRETRKMVLMK